MALRRVAEVDDDLRALDDLPANQREVFIAHELDGVSFKEMAEQTGVSINTLLGRKRYAVLFLLFTMASVGLRVNGRLVRTTPGPHMRRRVSLARGRNRIDVVARDGDAGNGPEGDDPPPGHLDVAQAAVGTPGVCDAHDRGLPTLRVYLSAIAPASLRVCATAVRAASAISEESLAMVQSWKPLWIILAE